ncbi:NAD(P)H-hydrate dehydratase [Acaryochloris sp. IP29b_bin.137]|uniref:NAD(P)H-hydrate dehydratase n=1 Tax=Acaryochloris sp. IP29b_bin.137 TaxID=2969217 RepID=UPI0026089DE0|nr:NAD(P)H-hydrate dehydratase [Acaryochloris sp. IP29b_bin.137]
MQDKNLAQHISERFTQIQETVVTAQQMRKIESRIFDAGMPVSALMEKVGGLIARCIQTLCPVEDAPRIGILAGPGHNGGDAFVVARELYFQGYEVHVCRPFPRSKDLTEQHARYVSSLGIEINPGIASLRQCDVIVDGLFGFGLERDIEGAIADLIHELNTGSNPVISIDLPSGLHTDTGAVLGTAIQATHTLCLGLWKLGLLMDQSLPYSGQLHLIDFDIPVADINAVLGTPPKVRRIASAAARTKLPTQRHPNTHKYRQGHCLLIGGSQKYAGSILLTALAARATGGGMMTIAVPASLKPLVLQAVPEALVVACPETEQGAIASLPPELSLDSFNAIAYGPGVTTETNAILSEVLTCACPLVLDADGLNLLAQHQPLETLQTRSAPTVLTPHPGEFKRLFSDELSQDLLSAVRRAAQSSNAYIVYKGARVILAPPQGAVRINPDSTPALARGGSGDVLTGIFTGLLSQRQDNQAISEILCSGIWWHAQAGLYAARQRTELGVDPLTLCQSLIPAIASQP